MTLAARQSSGDRLATWLRPSHVTSNICIDRSAKQLRCLVPSSLRSSAPGHAGR
jgi:hypothetical protein